MLRQVIIVIALSVLFGGTSLISLGSYNIPLDPAVLKLRYLLVASSLLILILMSPFKQWGFHRQARPLLFLWILFACGLLISGVANNDTTIFRDGLWQIIAVPLILFNAVPKAMKENANLLMGMGLFLGHIPYIVTSLVSYPPGNGTLYRGVFANSNQMGFTCATMSAGLFILLIGAWSAKKDVRYLLPISVALLSIFVLIILANSRTSMIVCFIMFSVFFSEVVKNPKAVKKLIGIATVAVTAVLLFGGEQIEAINKTLNNNFEAKEGLSGRDHIWGQTLDESDLLGHGSNYFQLNFGLGGHNTIIEVIGQNGIIAANLLVAFAISSLFYTYAYFKTYAKEDCAALAPFLITVCFWFLSMAEGMFGSLGNAMTLAYMLSIGIVISRPLSGNMQD
ncbi:O-antigen ligase family protein [Microcoleus sp. herbarium5]|uniref:O-antigen ligase family protein n=1 Tax=Microcoleus sp. herbarium5 TaxID=3055434 RepID=UPI002FD113CE